MARCRHRRWVWPTVHCCYPALARQHLANLYRALLLVSSPECALRLFRYPGSAIPTDHHVQEVFTAPQEILSIRKIRRDGSTRYSSLPGIGAGRAKRGSGVEKEIEHGGRETVLDGRIVDKGGLAEEYGPVLLLLCVCLSP